MKAIYLRAPVVAALAAASLVAGCGGVVDSGEEATTKGTVPPPDCAATASPASDSELNVNPQIINGTVPRRGCLASWGVVSLAGCTGTLLDNRHVITAHHCVRAYREATADWGDLASTIIARYEDGGLQQTAGTAQIFEPVQPWTLNGGDYSMLVLSVPLKVNGSATGYSRTIYAGADSTLADTSVLCIGYGGTVAATATSFAIGFDTLTSATMKITDTAGGLLTRPANSSGQVSFGGDSGSACFLGTDLMGIQSTCGGFTWVDVNMNGSDDGWAERGAPTSCSCSAPSQFRAWAATQLAVPVNTNFAYSAAITGGVL